MLGKSDKEDEVDDEGDCDARCDETEGGDDGDEGGIGISCEVGFKERRIASISIKSSNSASVGLSTCPTGGYEDAAEDIRGVAELEAIRSGGDAGVN